jgi:hypothetical protein
MVDSRYAFPNDELLPLNNSFSNSRFVISFQFFPSPLGTGAEYLQCSEMDGVPARLMLFPLRSS